MPKRVHIFWLCMCNQMRTKLRQLGGQLRGKSAWRNNFYC
jgi:hypothetical protein